MCKMLLSINPEHVDNIFKGIKRFEYRKIRCSRNNVDMMLIYSTAPVMKVVGEAQVLEIIEDVPSVVWNLTKEYAGINKVFFDRYYKGKQKAIAYRLGEVQKYCEALALKDFGLSFAPQSFVYID